MNYQSHFNHFEYLIHVNNLPNVIEYFEASYKNQKQYYYPILRGDYELCQSIDFSNKNIHTCIFYNDDFLYYGILTGFDARNMKLLYRIYDITYAHKSKEFFIEFDIFISSTFNNFFMRRNPYYQSPFHSDLLRTTEENYVFEHNLDVIYINDNDHLMALFKKPVFRISNRNLTWANGTFDKTSLDFWTIKHLLTTGIILRDGKHITFRDYTEFYDLVTSTGKSYYEVAFLEYYFDYLSSLSDEERLLTPLLIPEFRFDGPMKNHKYRLDYLIVNLRKNKTYGIELSPFHTHNDALHPEKQWHKENCKRNDYLQKYDIPILTFTEIDLRYIKRCFNDIVPYLKV